MSRELAVMGVLASILCISAQYGTEQRLAVGDILVANEKLGDPNFAQAVILLLQFDRDEGTLGLVINRPSEIPLSRIFPEIKHASADPVYMGGPVGVTTGQALLRLPGKAEQLEHISGDIYATGDKDLIEKSVSSRDPPAKFRLYFGYAGWAPGQLEAEMRLGAWSVLKGRSKLAFDHDPDSLWDRLIRESQTQMADGFADRATLGRLHAGLRMRGRAAFGHTQNPLDRLEIHLLNVRIIPRLLGVPQGGIEDAALAVHL